MESNKMTLSEAIATNQSNLQQEIFDDYYRRLVGIVQKNMHGRIARRIDASDVALSAFRSFFVHAHQGELRIQAREDLWKLLVTITLNKLRNQLRHHTAGKRSFGREENDALHRPIDRSPGPADAAAMNEELELLLSNIKHFHREIAERILAGQDASSIARDTSRSLRTVRRVEIALEKLAVKRFEERDG